MLEAARPPAVRTPGSSDGRRIGPRAPPSNAGSSVSRRSASRASPAKRRKSWWEYEEQLARLAFELRAEAAAARRAHTDDLGILLGQQLQLRERVDQLRQDARRVSLLVDDGKLLDNIETAYEYDRPEYVWPNVEALSRHLPTSPDISRHPPTSPDISRHLPPT